VKPKRLFWMVFTILIVSAVAGSFYFAAIRGPGVISQAQGASEAGIQQAVARIGNQTLSISGSGELVPATITDLRFPESGVLVEILATIGEEIKAGQVLARLHIDKTQAEHAAEIASAELTVVRAQQELEKLYENAQMDAAQAQTAVEEAQIALEELTNSELEQALALQDVVDAKAAMEEAEVAWYILNASPSTDAIYTAYASLLFKEKELGKLQDQIVKIEHEIKVAPNNEVRNRLRQQLISLQARLAQQQIEVENARYKYETMDDPADSHDVTVAETHLSTAQAQFSQAQRDWEKAQAGPKTGAIALAEAQLAQTQSKWERLKDGPDLDELALAVAELTQAQAKLDSLQQEHLVLDLVAPMDSYVSSVNAVVGDRITGQTILTLIDSSQPSVEVYLDENDLFYVQVGYQAEVVFEALPDIPLNGTIVEVDPSLAQIRGTNAVRALVHLDAMPQGKQPSLPIGLSATVNIIAGQMSDAVLVPLEAIQEINPGEYIVYVVHGEELERRQVSIGLMDFTSAEVLSGLAPGETVAIGEFEHLEGMP